MISLLTCSPVFGMSIDTSKESSMDSSISKNYMTRESDYINRYSSSLSSTEKGKLSFEGTLITTGTKITVQLQVNENGAWKNYKSAYSINSNNTKVAIEKTVLATSGKLYRANFKFQAMKNGKVVESRSATTGSSQVK